MDKSLNSLLKWSIENTAPSTTPIAVKALDNTNDTATAAAAATTTTVTDNAPVTNLTPAPLDREALLAILGGGGPSDADLMKAALEVIHDTDPENTLDNKLIAFDNFEQLIESLDNANNLENLSLWTPLLSLLSHDESELRRYAAWCVGTAVQNNVRTQERLVAMGGIPPLVTLATREGEGEAVRRKAVYALSSAVRNYQPAMDLASEELAKQVEGRDVKQVDAGIWMRWMR
ncbi:nucleotide exchange factor Fes1-domain-containing protein [Bombardia bombarda]|uniref:Nucleotide exchange factor Fes1-domain-containing protein n=1 Tax=Bombardia bombarda TaxID=252184 RepID=A0AA40CFC4_9PEZI|nr:nucleotide exchange factor Fes1-domain-containing protein [Bombardia bombarda]